MTARVATQMRTTLSTKSNSPSAWSLGTVDGFWAWIPWWVGWLRWHARGWLPSHSFRVSPSWVVPTRHVESGTTLQAYVNSASEGAGLRRAQ